jgi:hypothetical protein
MNLPQFIFYTGVPGSRWSGIAQEIKSQSGYNTSDRADHRVYMHGEFSGHLDSYFGTGMEFDCSLDIDNLNAPYTSTEGCKLLMSHEWPYYFEEIQDRYPDAWIQLVYRPDWESFLWWKKAGGFDISYPNYDWYDNDVLMRERIAEQNKLILDFGQKHSVQWTQHHKHSDIFIATHR